MIRQTAPCDISWPSHVRPEPISESMVNEIGKFLFRIKFPIDIAECSDGSLKSAVRYVQRLFDYHRNDINFNLTFDASTVVYDADKNAMIAMCLLGGGGIAGQLFGIYDIVVEEQWRNKGIGGNMIKRALTILHGHSQYLDLECFDDSPGIRLYKRLGFTIIEEIK